MEDHDLLAAALVGYEQQRSEIEGKIAELRRRLGGRWASVPAGSSDVTQPARKRRMSAAGRRRIAAAQRKRWAAFHKSNKPATPKKAAPTKRKMSAAARKRIAEAQRKRWAQFRVKKKAA
jgi:hypothetical protein